MRQNVENYISVIKQNQGYYSNYPVYAPARDTGGELYDVKAFGAVGDGVTDDLAAINKAIAAATPTAGVVFFPPATYAISNSIIVSPAGSSSADTNAVSIVGGAVAGRIGDVSTETSQVNFVPTAGFPSGKFMLDYVSAGATFSLNGMVVKGLGFQCNSQAAGVRCSNARRSHWYDISIDHPAIPSGYSDGSATAGFNVLQQNGTATAYSLYENISVAFSLKDGYSHSAAGNDTFFNCYDLNASGYAFKCQGYGRFISCHYEQSGNGWYVLSGQKQNMIIGADLFGYPLGNAVQVTSNGSAWPAQFICCNLQNIPSGSPAEEAGSVIAVQNNNQPILADFIGCMVQTSTHTTDFVYVESAVPSGSKVKFIGCNFMGTPTTKKFNDASGKNVLSFTDCSGIPNTSYNNNRTAVADTAYTALMSDSIIAYTSLSAGRQVTLPDATLFTGGITVKDEAGSAGANNITLATVSAQTIDGAATKVISSNFGVQRVYSNGANWFTY